MSRPGRAELVAYGVCALVVAVIGWRSLAGGDDVAPAREAVPAAPARTTAAAAAPIGARGAAPPAAGATGAPATGATGATGAPATGATGSTGTTGAPSAGATGALVHVVGAVRRPGVYDLPAGARVQEAIAEAGGATAKADLQGVNLAAKVADAQQIVVPRRGAAPVTTAVSGATPGAAPAAPVNLNTATEAELDTLPGVGPATAAKILEYRASSGGFRSVEDLANVPGIGPKRLEALREAVGV